MLLALSIATALASEPVVAIGDGLVAAPPDVDSKAPATSSWVAALADCLEERASGRFQVVDRSAPGETVRTAREKVASVAELKPAVVVVGLGARELGAARPDAGRFRKDLDKLVRDLKGSAAVDVLLVGVIAPTVEAGGGEGAQDQGALDALARSWNGALADLAGADGVRHVDLFGSWPKDGDERAQLTDGGWELSAQGHARVAAAVCDAVLETPEPAADAAAVESEPAPARE